MGLPDCPGFVDSGSLLSHHVLSSLDEFRAVAPEWDRLARESSGSTAFMTAAWLGAWWSTYPPLHARVILIHDTGGGLRGGLALQQRSERGPWKLLGAGTGDSYGLGVLAVEPAIDEVLAYLAELPGRMGDIRALELNPCLGRDSELTGRLAHALNYGGWILRTTAFPRMVLPLADSWSGFLSSMNARKRSNLLYESRRLERSVRLEFRAVVDPSEVDRTMDEFFFLHEERWGTRNENSFEDPRRRSFYREAAAEFARKGALDLFFLLADGAPIATHLGLRHGTTHHYLAGGFEPGMAALSPGNVILGRVFRHLIDAGVKSCDFLIGDETYKTVWGARREDYWRYRLARRLSRYHMALLLEDSRPWLSKGYRTVVPQRARQLIRKLRRSNDRGIPIEDS